MEFEVTYDRRNGKPIASSVSKIAPEVVSVKVIEIDLSNYQILYPMHNCTNY